MILLAGGGEDVLRELVHEDVESLVCGARATEALIKALDDEDKEVRHEAIYALYGIADDRPFKTYIKLLSDEDWVIRE